MPINTTNITLESDGKVFQSYLAEHMPGGPGILLLHAWWGLKPFFKQTCDRIAEQGYIVLAPDLRQGRIAQTIEEAEEMNRTSDDQLTGDTIAAALNYLKHYPSRLGEKVGIIGFSMGAAWALTFAARRPQDVGAVALFYGAGEGEFSTIQAPVLGHYTDVDKWEAYDYVLKMQVDLRSAGVDTTFHLYPGLAHWFVEEDRPEYNAKAARLAWDRTFDFLRQNL